MLFPLLFACAPVDPGELLGVPIREAWIYDCKLDTVAVIGGKVSGSGRLVAVPRDEVGFYGALMTLDGGTVGLDVEAVAGLGRDVMLELPDDTRGEEILGTYRGRSPALTVIAGADTHHLKNAHDVEFDMAQLGLGVGVGFSFEWLTVTPDEAIVRYETADDVEAWLAEELL